MPYFALQVVSNYRYKQQSCMCVGTIVQPVTGYLDKMYKSIDSRATIGLMAKVFLSNLRTDHINRARNNLLTACSKLYRSGIEYFKKRENLPEEII